MMKPSQLKQTRTILVGTAIIAQALLWGAVSPAQTTPAPKVASSSLAEADKAYAERTDPAKAEQALQLYEQAVVADSASTEALWKMSQAAWWVGDQSEDHAKKADLFQKGIDSAKRAIQLDPSCTPAHFWLGGNYGSYGEARGVLKSLFLVKPIRAEMDTVLKLDPSFLSGAAYRVLGVVDYKVPGFAGGSKKRALERIQKAISIGPNDPFNVYYLAEYYYTVGDGAQAKKSLDQLQSLTVSSNLMPDLILMQKKGKLLAGKIR